MKNQLMNWECFRAKGSLKIITIMRNILILMFLTVFQVFANDSYSQKTRLTLNLNDVTVENVLTTIEEQSEFYFLCNKKLVDVDRKVNVRIEDQNVEQILAQVFQGSDVDYVILDRQIVLSPKEYLAEAKSKLQPRTISGTVTDEEGEPVIGSTVTVRGTTIGAVSDMNGNYNLEVPTDAEILVFSFVGMLTQEVSIENQTEINITLETDVIGLEEVVVIGYGTQRKRDLTAAVTGVRSEQLELRTSSNLDDALVGQMSGIRLQQYTGVPGAKTLITIRGRNSIGNSSEPLYVVDGIIVDDLNSINSYDVESIQVLKDAASSAIYGAQGANGVILVSTKSGTSGRMNVSLDATMGIQVPDRIYPMMNKEEFYEYANMWWERRWILSGGDPAVPWESRPNNLRIPEYIHTTPFEDLPGTDWQDLMFDPALKQSYQITLNGGTDRTTYYVSARYLDHDGIYENTHMNRYTFRAKVESRVSDWLTAGTIISPTFETSNNFKSEGKNWTMHRSLFLNPLIPPDENTYDTQFWYNAQRNPYLEQKERIDENRDNSVITNLYAEIEFFKGLKFRSSYGLTSVTGNSKYFESNRFVPNQKGYFGTYMNVAHQVDNTLNFQRSFTSHNVSVLAGHSATYRKFWSSSQTGSGYPNNFVYTLNAASTPTQSVTSESERALVSYFGRIQYDFASKYLLTVNARYDGSSQFGPDNQWGFFPSASAGWKISEENFMSSLGWIGLLKLRASIGKAGNDKIGDYRWLSNLGSANYNLNGTLVNGYNPSNYSNTELSWEEMISRNIGMDLWILNNRLQFVIDVYNNDTEGILMNVPLPAQTGFTGTTRNYGKVNNRGVESEVTGHIAAGKLQWTSSFNITYNKNEVVDILDPVNLNRYGYYARLEEGYPIYSYYLYTWDGLVTQEDLDAGYTLAGSLVGGLRYKDLNGDNAITTDDISVMGSPMPKFVYGWNHNLRYGNFDLSVLLQAQSGGNVLFMAARQNDSGNQLNQFKHWTRNYRSAEEPGDGRYPITGSKWLAYSDHDLYSTNYIRLKNVSLGYNVPSAIATRLKMAGARVILTVDNALYWIMDENYPGVNLEAATAWTGPSNGADYITYPLARMYSLRIKLNF